MGRIWLLVLVPACFHPVYDRPACGPAGECPGALVCMQGFCEVASDAGAGDINGADLDGSTPDSSIDAASSIDAQACFGVGLVKVCFMTLPDHPVSLPRVAGSLDTTDAGNCDLVVAQQNGPQLCVIAGTTVSVSGSLVAIGSRPLVLVGTDTVTVISAGTLDVSSTSSLLRKGSGGNEVTCALSGRGDDDTGGAGGGAGGSFGTVGGRGGTGDQNDSGPPVGTGNGGLAGAALPVPTVLRGGCGAGAGGQGDTGGPGGGGGDGGDGGGAVYLIAGNRITVDGNVFASGGGGRASNGTIGRREGGGGGGSGGMIGLDAPTIQIAGRVVANGGGGAGGGGTTAGTRGGDGTTQNWNQRATGGTGDSTGPAGNGAAGTAAGLTTNIDGANSTSGGGGGAGGLGVIYTYGTLNGGAMMSPAPSQR